MLADHTKEIFKKSNLTKSVQHIVVLGGGWGGYHLSKGLLNKKDNLYKVTMINPTKEFLYTPLLATYGFGMLSGKTILANNDFGKNFKMIQGSAYNIKIDSKTIDLITTKNDKDEIKYDKLVIAIGGRPETYKIEGANNFSMFFKNYNESKMVKDRVRSILDKEIKNFNSTNKPLVFVFVGAGPTSIEMASELSYLIKKKYQKLQNNVSIKILDVADSILNNTSIRQKESVINEVKKRNIGLVFPITIIKVNKDEIITNNGNIPYTILFWNAGITANSININGLKTNESGIPVNSFLRLKSNNDIYAIGDCSILDKPLPKTAQVAKQQADYLIRQLKYDKKLIPFVYNHSGMIIPLDSSYSSVYMKLFNRFFLVTGVFGTIINRLLVLSMLPTYSNVFSFIKDCFKNTIKNYN